MITLNSRTVPGPALRPAMTPPAAAAPPPEAMPQAEPIMPGPAPLTASTVVAILAWATAALERLVRGVASHADPPAPSRAQPTIPEIKAVVAHLSGVTLADIMSARRAAAIARPRQVAMYLAKQLTSHSLPAIGREFGRDHTTVMHAVRVIARQIRTGDQNVIGLYQEAKRRLAG